MAAKIQISDLDDELLRQIGISKAEARADMPIEEKLVAMGKVLRIIGKMSNRDALWVLRKLVKEITGIPETRGGARNGNGKKSSSNEKLTTS